MIHSDRCFHCGSDILENSAPIIADTATKALVCCVGCKAITEHIFASGLSNYYEFRSDLAKKPTFELSDANKYSIYQEDAVLSLVASQLSPNIYQIKLSVDNMHCAACAWLIEQSLLTLDGVESVNVNTVSQRAEVKWSQNETSLPNVLSHLEHIGYPSQPFKVCDTETQFEQQNKQFIKRLGVAGLFTMQVMMLAFAMYFGAFESMEQHQTGYFKWLSMGLSLPVIFYSALPFLHGAIASLRVKRLNMDVPVSLAIYGAFAISLFQLFLHGLDGSKGEVFFESICMFTFLLLIGKYLEFKGKSRAVLSNANLNSSVPMTVNKIVGDIAKTTLVSELQIGERIQVKPGEHIPVDGEVEEGKTSVNESVLNGEFEPRDKQIGDPVFAGTINNDGTITLKVTAIGDKTTLSKVAELQSEFAKHKPKFGVFADKIAHWFVFSQLILALITYLYWYFVSPVDAIWIALSVLVATCPCALSLATPTAYTCVMSALNKSGILVKEPAAFDKLPFVSEVAFDKTGTLTKGKFTISEQWYSPNSTNVLIAAVVKLQSYSEHPIAQAFNLTALPVESLTSESLFDVQVHIGQGLSCYFQGRLLKVGSGRFCNVEQTGQMNVYVTYDNEHIASFLVNDSIKEGAKAVISELQQMGIKTTILSGDSSDQVLMVAKEIGVDHFVKSCTPEDKANYIVAKQAQGNTIAMVGDGVNDAPVFAVADISIAMGSGADISKFGSDVICLNNSVSSVTTLLKASVKTNQTVKHNLYWSIVYNLVILPVAMMGYVAPYIAVIGMSASSILVVSNSLKLLRTNRS